MHYLLRKQVVLPVIIFLSCASQLHAQKELFRRNHDDLTYYFGLTLGYNYSFLHISKSPLFLQSDSIQSAEPGSSGGIAMGLMATARLSDHFQVRANPAADHWRFKIYCVHAQQNKDRRSNFSEPGAAFYPGKFSDTGKIQFRPDRQFQNLCAGWIQI
jgi:hypothetical protein